MEFYGYTIEPEFVKSDGGRELIIWHTAGLGEYVIGRKNGIRWFIKRNNEYRFLTEEDLPDKELRDFRNVPAYKYKAIREELRRLMVEEGKLSKERDHVVVEEESFIDSSSNKLVIVSRFVDDVAHGFDFYGLHKSDFVKLCADIAVLLEKIHRCTVVHGDLKVGKEDRIMEGNIVVANEDGRLVPYIIDFDLSFAGPPAKNPENIPNSQNYESPEIVPYIDGDEKKCKPITTATDIFTLGIVFHQLWTGSFPASDKEKESAGRCIANGGTVTLNSKFNTVIGDSCGATLISLINWMLAKEPSARPTATQVVAVLNDELAVPDEYHKGDDVKPFTDLWYSDKFGAERLSVKALKEKGVVSFKNVNVGGKLKYIVKTADGKEKWMTIDEVIDAGYATRKLASVDVAWEEHNIDLLGPEEIALKGYVSVKRTDDVNHRYAITSKSGLSFTHGYKWLLDEGLAKRKPVKPIEGDETWPGHGKYADAEFLALRKVTKIMRVMYGDEQRYRVEFENRAALENVSVGTMKRLGYIK